MDEIFFKRWDEVANDPAKHQRLQDIYEKEKNKKPNCGDCLYRFFNEKVRKYKNKNKITTMTKTTYRLKKGAVVNFKQKKIHLTEATLTDELAKQYLKDNPSGIRYFEYAPVEQGEIIDDVPVIPVDAPKVIVKEEIVQPEKKRGRKSKK